MILVNMKTPLNIPVAYTQHACARWGITLTEAEAEAIIRRVRLQEVAAGREPKMSAVIRYLHETYRYYGHFQFLADLEAGCTA
jgi:hypothetical protein